MTSIFISHASANKPKALTLAEWLQKEGFNDLFLDSDPEHGLIPSVYFNPAIHDAIDRCKIVLFLVSDGWLESAWCEQEFDYTIKTNKNYICVLLEDIATKKLPKKLTDKKQIVNLVVGSGHVRFDVTLPDTDEKHSVTFSKLGLALLKKGLREGEIDPSYFSWPPKNDPDRSPFRGMLPLEAEDAGIFFGRDVPILDLLAKIQNLRRENSPRFLAILGASGSGKSSFLRAGILPRLQRDDVHFLPLPVIRPGDAAITGKQHGFLRCLDKGFADNGFSIARKELENRLTSGGKGLVPLLTDLANKSKPPWLKEESKGGAPTLVFAIDQGEELFSADGMEEGKKLLSLLRDLLQTEHLDVLVLCTIRSDFYESLQSAPELENIKQEVFSLPPMLRDAYRTVIEGPIERLSATKRSLAVDPRLVQALMKEINNSDGKDALPLLALTLESLYERYHGAGHLHLEQYTEMQGIKGAIQVAVAGVFKDAKNDPAIPRDRQECLHLLRHGLIPWLAGIDPDTKTPRRRIAKIDEIPEKSRPLIKLLIEHRLLASDMDDEKRFMTIEPAHESLLRQWDELKNWLEEDKGILIALEGVQRSSEDWESNHRKPEWLLHSAGRLEDAEKIKQRDDLVGKLTKLDWDYLGACRKQDDEQRDREKAEAIRLADVRKEMETAAVNARNHAESLVSFILFDLRDKLATVGRLDLMEMASKRAMDYFTQFGNLENLSGDMQKNRIAGLETQGDILVARGDLSKALATYQKALEIAKKQAVLESKNTLRQRNLSVSYNKIGEVLQTQENPEEALGAFQEGMAIIKRLAEMDPNNTQLQYDLSISCERIGGVLQSQGNFEKAIDAFQEGIAITKRLEETDQNNTLWQRGLSVSHNKIGDVFQTKGNFKDALGAFQEGMAITKRLAEMDQNNTLWQRDLSVSYSRIGDVLRILEKLEEALGAFQEGMAIIKRLAEIDPDNTQWQRDLAYSHGKIGIILVKMGKKEEAIPHFQQEIAIVDAVFARFPDQKPFRYDLDIPKNYLK